MGKILKTMVEERKTLSFLRRLKPCRFLVYVHLADSLARLASSPGDTVSDFPLGKIVSLRWYPTIVFDYVARLSRRRNALSVTGNRKRQSLKSHTNGRFRVRRQT
jgi:hypothetical protein